MLDALKVADTVLFLMTPSEGIDPTGHVLMSAIVAQGLPTSAAAIFNLNDVPIKVSLYTDLWIWVVFPVW